MALNINDEERETLLANNVKASEVQGVNTVGSKVVYRGREMVVIKRMIGGSLQLVNLSGVSALAKMLKINTVLQDLTYVASPPPIPMTALANASSE